MIGSAVPHDRQPLVGPFGPQPAQDIGGVLGVGAGIGPEPHLGLVVEVEAVEGELVRQARRARGDPEAPAALRPAMTEPGILMDVRLVEIDQQMPVVLGARQQIPDLLDKGLPVLPACAAGRLDRAASWPSSTTAPGDAGRRGLSRGSSCDRTPHPPSRPSAARSSAAPGRPRLGVAPRRCAGRRGQPSQGRPRYRGKGGAAAGAPVGQRLRTAGVVEMQPLHHGLRMTARARCNACGAAFLGDFVECQEALAGALMRSGRRQAAQVLRCLAPPGMINTQHDRGR